MSFVHDFTFFCKFGSGFELGEVGKTIVRFRFGLFTGGGVGSTGFAASGAGGETSGIGGGAGGKRFKAFSLGGTLVVSGSSDSDSALLA